MTATSAHDNFSIQGATAASKEDVPLVSVLLLSYNNIDGMFATIDSIMEQDYPRIELVISDDGTLDFSSRKNEIAQYVARKNHGNIECFLINSIPSNVGTVKNLNQAVRLSSGAFIKTISPEDAFSTSQAISKYVGYMRSTNYLVCFAKLRGVTDSGEYKYNLLACESDYSLLSGYSVEQTRLRLFGRNFLPGAAEFFSREVFDKFGLFPEDVRLIEDYSYWLHLTKCGVPFGYMDEILIDYRLSGVSSAGHYSEMFMEDMFTIYEKFIFPYDKRFGLLQGVYNRLKYAGLSYYMAEAQWEKKTRVEKIIAMIKYAPFFVYVRLQKQVGEE